MTNEEIKQIESDFSEMIQNAPDDDYGKILKHVAKQSLTTEQKEFLLDQGRTADSKVAHITRIVSMAARNSYDIGNVRDCPVACHFYFPVQLWIVLQELPDYFKKQYHTSKAFFPGLGITKETLDNLEQISTCLTEMNTKITDAELLALEYLRNQSSHFQASKYTVQYNPKTEGFSRDLNGKSRVEIRKTIQSVLNNYQGDIRKFSFDFAKRFNKDLTQLHTIVGNWGNAGSLV